MEDNDGGEREQGGGDDGGFLGDESRRGLLSRGKRGKRQKRRKETNLGSEDDSESDY